MKKMLLGLALACLMPMTMFGQTYSELWKEVEKAIVEDLPQTEIEVLRKIAKKAEKEQNYGQLMKAELREASTKCSISPDSLRPAVERLKEREQQAGTEVLRAVYDAVLGYVYENNTRWFGDESANLSRQYYDKALAHPDLLAKTKAQVFEPVIVMGDDSRIYDGDLLSVIAYEASRYDILRDYYLQKGNNRQAMLMSSLEALRHQRPQEVELYNNSPYLQRLDSLIAQYADLKEVGEVVIERYNFMASKTNATVVQKWEYLGKAIEQYGSWPRISQLRNNRNSLAEKHLETSLKECVTIPGKSQQVTLGMRGINRVTMHVYRIKATAEDLESLSPTYEKDYKKIQKLMVELPELSQIRAYEGKQPWETYEDSLTLSGLPVGIYLLTFDTNIGTQVSNTFYHVSDLRLLSQKLPDNQMRYVVVNATSGQPVKGAHLKLSLYKSKGGEKTVTLTTDNKGECFFDVKENSIAGAWLTTADDKACPSLSAYGYFSMYNNDREVKRVEIYTDRSIYRPGQPVHAAAIIYTTKNGYLHQATEGKSVTMRLRDANREVVSEQQVVTDEYGTCAADFILPRQGLTGSFSIDVDGQREYFRVEEYKRPTFEVEIPAVKENYADGDTLQVKGTARSYAGVPVQGAQVKYKVERRRAFWWMSYSRYWNQGYIVEASDDELLASGETVTDADGTFTVPMPLTMPKTNYPMFYNFVVSADVTDQAGETHQAELALPLGNRKTAFSIDLPSKVLAEKGANITFHLRNAAGNDIDASVRYRIDSGKWQETKTNVPILKSQLSNLKSGSHTVEAICEGDTVKQSFIVFSLDDQRPAIETDDWFYVSDSQFPNDGKPVTVQVGSSANDVHIVYTLIAGRTLIESGSIDKSNALVNRKFTYKEDYGDGILLTFAWVKEGKTYTHQTTIRRPLPDKKLKLQWQTFRNRLTPGQQEEWTMTILDPDGKPAKAQLMATLYDKSLDQLCAHNWSLLPYQSLSLPNASWRFTSWGSLHSSRSWRETLLRVPSLEFSYFDHDIYPEAYAIVAYGRAPMMMARMKAAAPMEEEAEMMMDAADDSMQEVVVNQSVEEEKDLVEEQQSEADQVQMRENLQETAFFYPRLTTDSEGRVALKFTLPESLTTWRFMGIAHTTDLMYGSLTDEAVAKKDVMIQPNVPRFIRMGDRATISARIFNTGEKAVTGKARIELIDPETEKVVFADEQPVELAAGSTFAQSFNFVCTEQTPSLLIAKMMVSGEGFSDGEQHYLPVLPNRERVTVTVPFTQNEPGTKTIDLQALLPKAEKGKAEANSSPFTLHPSLTIEYTNNPAWLMIQALPSVGHPYDNCALCQSSSYYANAIGRYIIQQNPNVKGVFEVWSREDSQSSTLQSQLSKNEELKDLVLSETPWVMDANREQEQKDRLADFFDTNLMDQRLSSAIDRMKALQGSDGSWSWWPGMSGSMYMTVEISEMLVRLNQMIEVQESQAPVHKKMLDKAFGFMGNEIVDMVNEMKKQEKKGVKVTFPSHMALQWLYICTLDGRQLPSKVQAANDYLIKLLKKETRNQSIYDKAMSAIVLNNKTYVKSLKEYTVYKEEMGRYYDTPRALYSWRDYRIPTQVAAIEAIQRLTPDDTQTISEMQRWLLQEKRTQAWDTPINSVDAVYAFLSEKGQLNSEKLTAAAPTVLKVDGKEIETSKATAGLGYVKAVVPSFEGTEGGSVFTAEKTSDGTSWGAVYMQFMQPTSDIKDQSSGISVKREIIIDNSKQTANVQCKVGDRIKVRLTIEADRDYDFVQVVDKRAACMEPVNQLSGYHWGYYCAPKDCSTNYYFDLLSKGRHVIETEYYIDRAGTYETGTCTAGCAYSPEFRGTTHSMTIEVKER